MRLRRPDGKRIVDIAMAVPAFALSLPLQGVVALLVAVKLGRPVLFKQSRPGLNGKPFILRKFRSMVPMDESLGRTDDASRISDFGRWLRSTSLDELPTLWNVIRGDMSLVGPRPLLMEYLPLYSPEQARRHDMRPGLTGLAQVSGRNAISWDQRLQLDIEYVEKRSLSLDIRILVRTASAVLRHEGISAPGEATMSAFLGGRPND